MKVIAKKGTEAYEENKRIIFDYDGFTLDPEDEKEWEELTPEVAARVMDEDGQWYTDYCEIIAKAAGLEDEWEKAEYAEDVMYKAGEILGIDI